MHWKVDPSSLNSAGAIVLRWHLETPVNSAPVSLDGSLPIQGWALALSPALQSQLHWVLRFRNRTLSAPCNQNRPDVVEQVCQASPEGHLQLQCGFFWEIDAIDAAKGFEVGFEIDGLIRPIVNISLES